MNKSIFTCVPIYWLCHIKIKQTRVRLFRSRDIIVWGKVYAYKYVCLRYFQLPIFSFVDPFARIFQSDYTFRREDTIKYAKAQRSKAWFMERFRCAAAPSAFTLFLLLWSLFSIWTWVSTLNSRGCSRTLGYFGVFVLDNLGPKTKGPNSADSGRPRISRRKQVWLVPWQRSFSMWRFLLSIWPVGQMNFQLYR